MGSYIDIKKIIDVSTTLPAVSLARRDFSAVCFMQVGLGYTTGEIRSYSSVSEIALDLGSNSQAYKFALKFFQGGFNGIRPTQLKVGLINSADAVVSTQGNFTTGDVETNLVALQAITDGEFGVEVNGGAKIEVKNMDFTGAVSLAGVATLLKEYLVLNNIKKVDVSYDSTAKKFVFLSSVYGDDSAVVISSITGDGTDLTGVTLLNGGVATSGVSGTQATTIANFMNDYSFYHIALSNTFNEAKQLEWVEAVESATKYAYTLWILSEDTEIKTTSITADTGSIAKNGFDRKWKRSFIVYADDEDEYLNASFVSLYAYTDFTEARPLGSLKFKEFSGALASEITSAQFDNLIGKNVNFYATYGEAGRSIGYVSKAPNGNLIKDIILADWLDYNMTYNIYDWAIQKIDIKFTSADFAELESRMEEVLITAKGFGGIVAGNDPDTGELYINGYKITIPAPNTISSADKSAGLLKNIQVIALTGGEVGKIVIANNLKLA
jgi:hypothetical protein